MRAARLALLSRCVHSDDQKIVETYTNSAGWSMRVRCQECLGEWTSKGSLVFDRATLDGNA